MTRAWEGWQHGCPDAGRQEREVHLRQWEAFEIGPGYEKEQELERGEGVKSWRGLQVSVNIGGKESETSEWE